MNGDLISREDLKKAFKNKGEGVFKLSRVNDIIDNAPTVEAYPFEQVQELVKLNQQFAEEIENLKRPQGEWITENLEKPYGRCNQCGEICEVDNYCGNCGAKMKGAEE